MNVQWYMETEYQADLSSVLKRLDPRESHSLAISMPANLLGGEAWAAGSLEALSAWDLTYKHAWRDVEPLQRVPLLLSLACEVHYDQALAKVFGRGSRAPFLKEWRRVSRCPRLYGALSSAWDEVLPTALFAPEILKAGGLKMELLEQFSKEWARFTFDRNLKLMRRLASEEEEGLEERVIGAMLDEPMSFDSPLGRVLKPILNDWMEMQTH